MIPDAKLVFDVPDWPVVLGISAVLLLGYEFVTLIAGIWLRSTGVRASLMTAAAMATAPLAAIGAYMGGPSRGQSLSMIALLAGPLISLVAGSYGLVTSVAGQAMRGKSAAVISLRGAMIVALAVAIIYWPCEGALAAIAACSIVWMFRGYAKTTTPIRRKFKILLLGLRIALILLLMAWLIRPALEYHKKIPIPSAVLVGLDASASMQRRDMPRDYKQAAISDEAGPVKRIEAVRSALADQDDALKALANYGAVEFFSFPAGDKGSTGTRRLASWLSKDNSLAAPPVDVVVPDATGLTTALGDSLAEAYNPYASTASEISAIILLSDGCNNTADVIEPDKEADVMGSRGVPIYTVGIGSTTVTKSIHTLNVKELHSPDEVEAFNRLPITAAVEAIGMEGKQIKVTCSFGEKEVASEEFTPDSKQTTHTFSFTHVPLSPGFHRLSVTAACPVSAPADLEGQYTATKLVHVMDRELRVLYVEGKFRPEAKYVGAALAAASRFHVDRRYIIQPLGAEQTPPLSEDPDEWLKYHAIIFGDVAASHFTPKQLEIIKTLVGEKGKGFCMIGGSESFGRGGWGDTPIADVLPVDVKASNEQIEGLLHIIPTPDGLRNEIMRIASDQKSAGADGKDVADSWKQLTLPNGANKLVRPKPGAVVLAGGDQGQPLIVSQNYGSGRSLAIAFDETWRWILSPKDTAKETAEFQRRFWRQVALYLAAPKGNVWIGTDKTSYDMRRLVSGAETVDATAGVEDATGASVPEDVKEVTLAPPSSAASTAPGTAIPIKMERAGDHLKCKLPPPSLPGTYTLKINAEVGGKPLTAEHRFEVVERDLESKDVLANFDALKQMASASNGKFCTLSNFPQMLRDLEKTLSESSLTRVRDVPVRTDIGAMFHWPILFALMGLLCLEWALRKRKGMV